MPKHWVRLTTRCTNRCLFCLDADAPRDLVVPTADVRQDIDRGRDERGALQLVLSGGEPTLHPALPELIRYARQRGYRRVQLVTNGRRLAERRFFEACLDAGLGEITFSLHGHTEELHDRLTRSPGSFKALLKGLLRAVRDGRPIVNVDVVISKLNVDALPDIIELCLSLGVTELDLLQIIPQGAAFAHRDELLYDLAEHLPVLERVFRLSRHRRLTLWTNRFPPAYLEGFEDLIQDPAKLLDEVHGRRFQLRRYLDLGEPLDCRDPARCPHCFIEPFCTTADDIIALQHDGSGAIWWIGEQAYDGAPLPFGTTGLGVRRAGAGELLPLWESLPAETALVAALGTAEPLPAALGSPYLTLLAAEPEQLDAWLQGSGSQPWQLEVQLSRRTAPWLLAHRELVAARLPQLTLHQPSYAGLERCRAEHLADPRDFFTKLALPVPVSGLPLCLAPGALPHKRPARLSRELFDACTGRLDITQLARHHIARGYFVKSLRCGGCAVSEQCRGAHLNQLRIIGLRALEPLAARAREAAVAALVRQQPVPLLRLATGRPPEPVAPSLPGFAQPTSVPPDPLMTLARRLCPASEPPADRSEPWRT